MSPHEASISEGWGTETPIVEVPGGRHAKIRRRPIETFYKEGLIPNSLMPVVRDAILKGEDFNIEDFNDSQVIDLLSVMDMMVVECVEEPRVYPIPVCRTCEGKGTVEAEKGPKDKKTKIQIDCPACEGKGKEERVSGRVYVDEVPFDVKNFVYAYVIGGVDDLESFLAEANGSVEPVSERKDVESKAKRTARGKR